MGRSHNCYCEKCECYYSPFDFDACPCDGVEAGSFRNDMGYETKEVVDWIKESAEKDRALMDELWQSRYKRNDDEFYLK